MSGKYDDIIHLPHPTSSRHPRMSITDRAAQFSPFSALTGHDEAISETARPTDQKVELGEDAKALLDHKQRILSAHIKEHPQITVTWFQPDTKKSGGKYLTAVGGLKKIDEFERVLILTDGTRIPLEDVADIKSFLFGAYLKTEELPNLPYAPEEYKAENIGMPSGQI